MNSRIPKDTLREPNFLESLRVMGLTGTDEENVAMWLVFEGRRILNETATVLTPNNASKIRGALLDILRDLHTGKLVYTNRSVNLEKAWDKLREIES